MEHIFPELFASLKRLSYQNRLNYNLRRFSAWLSCGREKQVFLRRTGASLFQNGANSHRLYMAENVNKCERLVLRISFKRCSELCELPSET